MSWYEMMPGGRNIYYEGKDPEGFRKQIIQEFGFDPGKDPRWGKWIEFGEDEFPEEEENKGERGFYSYPFHCPGKYLDAIYGSERFPLGS